MLITALAFGQTPGNIDPSFNPIDSGFDQGVGPSTFIRAIAQQTDGKIILSSNQGLLYNQKSVPRLIRLNPNGLLDTTFNSGTGPFGNVEAIAVQSNSKILIGGDFFLYNNVIKGRLVRLNSDGSLDSTFNAIGSGFNHLVTDIALQPDGKIIVSGDFSIYNNASVKRIIRLDTNGNIDPTFSISSNPNGRINDIELLPDGKLLVAGNFTQFNGTPCGRLTRLLNNGFTDTAFSAGQGANYEIKAICVDSSGNIYAGGGFDVFDGDSTAHIAKLDAFGNLDTVLNNTLKANSTVYDVKVDANQNLVLAGSFTNITDSARTYIARIKPSGVLDSSFIAPLATIPLGMIESVLIQLDGKVLTLGYYTKLFQNKIYFLSRLNSDGSLDVSFNQPTGANDDVYSIAVQADRRLIIGGKFTEFNGYSRNKIARLLDNGELDASFFVGSGFDETVNIIKIQSNGKILVGGNFTQYKGATANYFIRLNQDGSPDTTFNIGIGANDPIHEIEFDQGGKILLGGSFSRFNGIVANGMVRLNSDGTIDTSFSVGSGFNQIVMAIKTLPTGRLLAGGNFNIFQGNLVGSLLRLNNNGSLDTSLLPSNAVLFHVYDIETRTNGRTILGGRSGYLREIDTNGITLNPILAGGSTPNGSIYDIIIQPDNKIVICGEFTKIGSINRRGLARYNANGTPDYTFNTGVGTNFIPPSTYLKKQSLALQYDSLLIYGGEYSSINNVGKNRLSRIFSCGPEVTIDSIEACNQYTWIDSLTYTSSTFGNPLYFKSKLGCDSTVLLALTIDTLETMIFKRNDTLFASPDNLDYYRWINCDSANVTYPAFNNFNFIKVPANGRYALVAKKGACTDTSSCIQVVDLGNTESKLNALKVYPNPNTGIFNIEVFEPIIDLTIFNGTGVEVKYIRNGNQINLVGMPNGIYQILLETKNGNYTSRLYLVD